MKLNPECIRDLLLDIEKETDIRNEILYDLSSDLSDSLAKYSNAEIEYHLMQCHLNGFLINARFFGNSRIAVDYLSPVGHRFLADIRSDTVWSRTTKVAGKIGTWSLDTLSKIAANVIAEIIKQLSIICLMSCRFTLPALLICA